MVSFLLLSACDESLTRTEAAEALDEAVASAKGEAATAEIIEVSTDFTIGGAVDDAAAELRDWLESQIPCSVVTREGPTVTVDFGTLDDACVFNGHTYAGLASVTVERNDVGAVEVTHAWEGLTNGEITVDGGAVVTWSQADATRTVVHDVVWTDLERSVHGTGDRTMALVSDSEGLAGGIVIDGVRAWTVTEAEWNLDIDGVQMRGIDPVPQAGQYVLTLPNGKVATLTFERIDDATIRVTFDGGRWQRTYDVSGTGE